MSQFFRRWGVALMGGGLLLVLLILASSVPPTVFPGKTASAGPATPRAAASGATGTAPRKGSPTSETGLLAFDHALKQGRVRSAVLNLETRQLVWVESSGATRRTGVVDPAKTSQQLVARGVEVQVVAPSGFRTRDLLLGLAFLAPLLFLPLVLRASRRRSGGAQEGRWGIAEARELPETRFADVAGCDEAKQDLAETVSYLKDPDTFLAWGVRPPKGVLLFGPPGTGKTLLARAVAGEAGVPFFRAAGSDFVEMYVGVGASRVREIFQRARRHAPCMVFIDEIDAIGRARGASATGGNEERESTLNQLLVEMDGFSPSAGIVVMAATNRPDVLDPALTRPGRFDRRVMVDRPDAAGREAILGLHLRNKRTAPDLDLAELATFTTGFTGADLENACNEAALVAMRRGREHIGREEFSEAVERVVAGPERKSRRLSPQEKRVVAYHEVGHALVARLLPGGDPVKKVSIVPRGMGALGYTLQTPREDRFLSSRGELLNRICVLLGGRAAEDLSCGDVTTGAQNDLKRANGIARRMVTEFGMGEKLGLLTLAGADEGPLRFDQPGPGSAGPVAQLADSEVRDIVETCYGRVTELLSRHREAVERLTGELLNREVILGEDVDRVLAVEG